MDDSVRWNGVSVEEAVVYDNSFDASGTGGVMSGS
jgi:hypothetical protein